jgi:EAL domain-containing protein (putative c-di-GMP-specific phosphodiesterase class I)
MSQDYSGLRVLLIDDQAHVRRFVRDQLGTNGITDVTEASSGREGLQAVTAPGVAFDLILCDLRMPEMDGIETIRAMANMGLRTSVAILSVENERVIESAGMLARLGGLNLVGEVPKPLTPEKLEGLLERVTNQSAPAPAPSAPTVSEAEVAAAVAAGAFTLVYQPRVHMRNGVSILAEATTQWAHPALGTLASTVFLPVIERSPETLAAFTTWQIREAIAACGRWTADGHELGVAINLRPAVLSQLDLPDVIERTAAEHRVPNGRVTVEVAESRLGADLAPMVDVAARLRIKRIRVALDEYTGAQQGVQDILKLPFNEIVLAASCVDGCSTSAASRAVVEAGLAVARSLKLTTAAVGISRRTDWNLLAELGCDSGQGNFIARAMPEVGLGIWAAQWVMQREA